MEDLPTILRALQSALGLYGATYMVTAICVPRWFLETLAVEQLEWRYRNSTRQRNILSPGKPWYAFPVIILTMIAVGVVVYAAAYALVAVIPYDWGSLDDNGDWQSARHYIQGMAALLGGIGLVMRLEKTAEILVWGPIERQARQKLAEAVGRSGVPRELRDVLAEKVNDEPEPGLPITYERDYEAGLNRAVQREIKG